MISTAVILVGGKGRRLHPYTIEMPKPLVPLGDMPVLEVVIRQLARHGFSRIVLAVNHMAHLIKDYFGDGKRFGIDIFYSQEFAQLGTMGPLSIIDDLPPDFLVMNGDILSDINFSGVFETHVSSQAIFTVVSHRREQRVDYGILDLDEDGKLIGFREKPSLGFVVSAGVYVASKRVVRFIPGGQSFGFDELMLALIRSGEKINVLLHEGYWQDIGRPEDYEKARDDFQSSRRMFVS